MKIKNSFLIMIVMCAGLTSAQLDTPSRLTFAAIAETRRDESQANRQGFAGLPAIKSYPQPIHKGQKLWKTTVKRETVSRYGNRQQWQCINQLIQLESSWQLKAKNPQSTAFGLFQLLKLNTKSKLHKQIRHGMRYIEHRYKTPCNALQHHKTHGWY